MPPWFKLFFLHLNTFTNYVYPGEFFFLFPRFIALPKTPSEKKSFKAIFRRRDSKIESCVLIFIDSLKIFLPLSVFLLL